MKDFNYSEKIHCAKTTEERIKINNDFIKYRKKIRKIENLKKYLKENILIILDLIIAIAGMIISIIALFK